MPCHDVVYIHEHYNYLCCCENWKQCRITKCKMHTVYITLILIYIILYTIKIYKHTSHYHTDTTL